MQIESLAKKIPEWINDGNPLRSLLFSKVLLVRNIIGFSFPGKSSNDGKLETRDLAVKAIENTLAGENLTIFNMEDLTELQRKVLVERRLIPREFAEGNIIGRSVAITSDEALSIYLNFENHISVQVLKTESNLRDGFERAFEIVTHLSDELDFAFNKELGFLTASLADTGIGAKFTHFFHIPVLEIERQTQNIGKGSDELFFSFERDEHLTNTGVEGFYIVKNLSTLGIGENKLIDQLDKFSQRIVEYETKMQGIAYIDNKEVYEDKGFRALGTLQTARMLSFQECVQLLSDVRTALILKFLDRKIDPQLLLKLMFQIYPGHLSVILNKLEPADQTKTTIIRNIEKSRADFLRTLF